MEDPILAGADEPGLTLIETLRGEDGTAIRAGLHLDRMADSAARLGWAFDRSAAAALLAQPAGAGAQRLRLTLDAAGRLELQQGPLPEARAIAYFSFAKAVLWSDDPWLRIKTNRRAQYDAARADLAEGVFDAVFENERGEICEGAISNIFFDKGAGMRTPPLSSGLLPGVLRQVILAEGAQEEVLRREDLSLAKHPRLRLWLGNSLRGLIPAMPV